MNKNVIALRMQRNGLDTPFNIREYEKLFIDTLPVQSIYFHGFGQPPSIPFRASFDDVEYNRNKQLERQLVKGRFQGGNVGWVDIDQLELFIALYIKPIKQYSPKQQMIYDLIMTEGPLTIQLIKEMTGLLVKEITPILHKLQQEFSIYEDQNDGEWDRGWYKFEEVFTKINKGKYTKNEALQIVIQRFGYRNVFINEKMVKSFYKFTLKDIKTAIACLVEKNILMPISEGYILTTDKNALQANNSLEPNSIYILDRNDFLVKSNEYWLKEKFKSSGTTLQYILINGKFKGAVKGKFKYGPYIIEDVIFDLSNEEISKLKDNVIEEILSVNSGSKIDKFNGQPI